MQMNLQIIIIRNNTELIYRLILGPKPRKTINAPRRGALYASVAYDCYYPILRDNEGVSFASLFHQILIFLAQTKLLDIADSIAGHSIAGHFTYVMQL